MDTKLMQRGGFSPFDRDQENKFKKKTISRGLVTFKKLVLYITPTFLHSSFLSYLSLTSMLLLCFSLPKYFLHISL